MVSIYCIVLVKCRIFYLFFWWGKCVSPKSQIGLGAPKNVCSLHLLSILHNCCRRCMFLVQLFISVFLTIFMLRDFCTLCDFVAAARARALINFTSQNDWTRRQELDLEIVSTQCSNSKQCSKIARASISTYDCYNFDKSPVTS